MDLARRRFAFEAFLRRVPRSGVPLVLKGGYLLHMRYPVGPRPTKDLDAGSCDATLSALPAPEVASRMRVALEAVAAVPDTDFFTFQISAPIDDLGVDREFVGYRFRVTARLDSRVFDSFHVDFTVGDALIQPLDSVTVGDIFWFVAGLVPVQVPSISPAQHLAEKLHAICRVRGQRENNRVKDLIDVVLLSRQGVTAQPVAALIGAVFAQAGNTPLERLNEAVPESWRVPFDALAEQHHLQASFDDAIILHRRLCNSILKPV